MSGMIRIATRLVILIIGLIAGPAVSLYGSPTVSPVTAAAWASEPLPPSAPSSISFFALSPAPPPARRHRDRQEEPRHDRADQQAAEHARVDQPDHDRDHDRDQRRQQHALDRRAGDDVDRATVFRPSGALHDPGDLAELTAHLGHDLAADASDGLHRER